MRRITNYLIFVFKIILHIKVHLSGLFPLLFLLHFLYKSISDLFFFKNNFFLKNYIYTYIILSYQEKKKIFFIWHGCYLARHDYWSYPCLGIWSVYVVLIRHKIYILKYIYSVHAHIYNMGKSQKNIP